MTNRAENTEAFTAPAGVAAGSFSQWLQGAEASLRSGKGGADVPCGTCKGCCRSSMFIPIKPDEKRTIQRIPHSLLFPVPGMPNGHVLLGYDDQGHCPMLVDSQCSIYEDRPQTCRDYDCRFFAGTGISVDQQMQPEIADRVRQWVFDYESEESREEHRIVKRAAAFLEENRELFPAGSLPSYPVQLAALAVSVYRLFSAIITEPHRDESALSDAAIAHSIVAALNDPEDASGPQSVKSK